MSNSATTIKVSNTVTRIKVDNETKTIKVIRGGPTIKMTAVGAGPRIPTAHAASHENGGTDEIDVGGLSGLLADPQTPTAHAPSAHAASHENGGADEIDVGGLSGALADDQTAGGIRTATTVVAVAASAAPTVGQVLKATADDAAAWDDEAGGGDVNKVGAPADNEIGVWVTDGTIEGDPDLTWDGDRLLIVWQSPGGLLNNTGIVKLNDSSVINTVGWQEVPGSPGLFDGELLFASDPNDTVNSVKMRLMPNNAVIFALGVSASVNFAFRSEAAGALAFFMPQDTTGREETKISFVGEVGGTGHEGVFSIEGFAYSTIGLVFKRIAHFVIDADGVTVRTEFLGNVSVKAGYLTTNSFTDAQLNDITHAVNTDIGKEPSAQLWNSSQLVPVWAVGSADGSVWVNGAGATVNTPI